MEGGQQQPGGGQRNPRAQPGGGSTISGDPITYINTHSRDRSEDD